jgi:glycosyltransferase involved in cell wall biosynthesis
MHTGIPVVVTDAVGAAAGGLVENGRNGIVVPERDVTALAKALGSLAMDPDSAARMGAAARHDVARFNYESMADAFTAAMEYAVARRAPRDRVGTV